MRCLPILLFLSACVVPPTLTDVPLAAAGPTTRYAIEEQTGGFVLTIEYSRQVFFPDTRPLFAECGTELLALAHSFAQERGRALRPVDVRQVRYSTGRPPLSGGTVCFASVPVLYRS